MAGSSVKVAVRARPLNKREIDLGAEIILSMEDKSVKIVNKKVKHDLSLDQHVVKNPFYEKQFSFDYAYWSVSENDPHYTRQDQIYRDLGEDVVQSALLGYNACIFAYGQTGAGKTFTMMGSGKNTGLIPRISEKLFTSLDSSSETSSRVEISYIEIYNEQVRDLLRSARSKDKKPDNLRIREHPKEGPFVQGVTVHPVSDFAQMEHFMNIGNAARVTASTMMNDTSSRSHAIFCIKFTQAKFSENVPSETVSKLNLVDLAGSERASASGATGVRLKEGGSINKSLSTLGLVISALAEKSTNLSNTTGSIRKSTFVPYRDSVLTWLLKDSLGGNSKTIMIAAISPADVNYGETLSTLRYASRAMKIVNKPTINEDPNVKLIRELRAEIERLKEMILNSSAKDSYSKTVNEAIEAKLAEDEQKAEELIQTWKNKWNETQTICQEEQLIMRRRGRQTLLISEKPHLVGIDVDPLSAEIVIYRLENGVTVIGSEDLTEEQGIALYGSGIDKEHCLIIVNKNGTDVLIKPISAKCYVNGNIAEGEQKLNQGDIIQFGDCLKFRFNNPKEAELLIEKRRSGNFSLAFSMSYSKDRSLDSGLSCPDDDLDLNENENLTPQDVISSVSCPDFDGKQRRAASLNAESQTSQIHPKLRRTASHSPLLPETSRFEDSFDKFGESPPKVTKAPLRTSTPVSKNFRRWSQGDSGDKHLFAGRISLADRTLSFNTEDFDEKRNVVRDMMNKYRKKEVDRIENDRQFRRKADQEMERLKQEKIKLENLLKKHQENMETADVELMECKDNSKVQKAERRAVVEGYVDRIVESMRKKTRASPELERDLQKRKFQIRSKVEEFWKKMDLYENCLLGIELEKKKQRNSNLGKENGKGKLRAVKSEPVRSKRPDSNNKEQRKILAELLSRHKEALLINEKKLEHIDTSVDVCEKKYAERLQQGFTLLKELKDQKVLTENLIEQEKSPEEARSRADSGRVHTLRYVNSVSSPLHIEQEVGMAAENSAKTMFEFENAFETGTQDEMQHISADIRHRNLSKTPSKCERLEVRKDKYENMIKDAERSILELKNARALEADQYSIEKQDTLDLCKKIERRIEDDQARLTALARESDCNGELIKSDVNSEREQLLQSRVKVADLFEKSLQASLKDATSEIKELHRTSWGGFGLSRAHKYAGINEFIDCVMKSVEIYNLEEIAEKESELVVLKKDVDTTNARLREVEEKEASLQVKVLNQMEKRKVRSDLSRVKHYQEISRSVEQLIAVSEGKDPTKSSLHLSKEAHLLAKSREKLEDLEKSMLTKVKESKNLQQKLRNVQERLKSTSNEFDDYDDAVDCRIELEMEELEYKKEECDQDINKLYERLEEERQQYIDILKCKEDYVIIGKEYREARQIMMKVLGNQAAADVQKEVFWASNALDLVEQGVDPSESPLCGGWRPLGRDKDVTVMRKILKNGVQCFIGCGVIKVAPRVVWESVRNPLSRFIYDNLLKKINVVEHVADNLKVVYMRHEGRVCVMRHSRDSCIIHSERDQSDMMIAASQSVEHPDCPEFPNIIRMKLLPSGWAVEPHFVDCNEWSLVWYIVKVNLGGSLPNALLNFLCKRLPLSIAYLRSYLILN
ncbi:kinesin-like protein KIF16B [Rhopilema esculentum]|uniref:kinesin-like protein KIF16B n=1 Tax=Rhopilema esculentum TaxID=499914 RepID=UPI0031D5C196